jgi:hypothetical protein
MKIQQECLRMDLDGKCGLIVGMMGANGGGNDSSCQDDNDDNVPGFITPLTLAAIGTAGLMTRRD